MSKMLEIPDCEACPESIPDCGPDRERFFCGRLDKRLESYPWIPDDCPLPDVVEC